MANNLLKQNIKHSSNKTRIFPYKVGSSCKIGKKSLEMEKEINGICKCCCQIRFVDSIRPYVITEACRTLVQLLLFLG